MDELRSSYEGRWWLPEHKGESASGGALTIGGELGGVLRLNGAFPWDPGKRSEPRNQPGPWYDLAVINGESADGGRITLLKAAVTRMHTRLGGTAQSQQLVAANVIVGEHLEEPNPLFDGVMFELSHLSDWSSTAGHFPVSETGDKEHFVVTYSRVPERTAPVPDLGEVALVRDSDYRADSDVYTLRDFTRFEVRLTTPLSMDDLFTNAVAPLQNLLTFAGMTASRPRLVYVTCPDLYLPALEIQAALAVYRTGVDAPAVPQTRDSNPYRWLFGLESSPVPFDKLVMGWFDLSNRLGPIIDLYLSIDYAPPVHMETRFINMCQAAEGYHRAMIAGTALDPELHEELVHTLLEHCPVDQKEWLRGILKNSNEPSFKRRIEELVDRAGPAVGPLMKSRPKYAKLMRDHRNTFAHWLSTEPPAESRGDELFDLIRVTRFVLAACFLQDLGWSAGEVEQAFATNLFVERAIQEGRRSSV
jgi:ApeA N-terminal domain 1